jgi:hypothetical protein
MVATIVLNQSNIVPDGKNNTLSYKFPNSVSFPHHEIAIQNITMYYSWENINTSPLSNDTFSYVWRVAGTDTPYNIQIPNGLYEVSDLNYYLQYIFIKNGHYLINSAGKNVYYAEFLVNATRYAVQINTFPVPTSAGWTYNSGTNQWTGNTGTAYAGWTTPTADTASGSSAWAGFPTTTFNPELTIPNNLNKILGFSTPNPFKTSINSGVGTNLSYVSDTSPQVQPNSSVYVAISNIANKYAIPNSIIYSLSPSVAFGEQIIEKPPQFAWNKLLSGTYNELRISILGINFQPLTILDPNMTLVLVIRDTKDIGGSGLTEILSGGKG